jgi:hypothetical protein
MNTHDVDASLEDIEFLSRSPHRVRALRTLRAGPADRDDLRAATEASKATVSRLLNEFEDRNWVVRDGHEYELTDPGEAEADPDGDGDDDGGDAGAPDDEGDGEKNEGGDGSTDGPGSVLDPREHAP